MAVLQALTNFLFLPGTLVLSKLGITVEEDSGVLRSFVNACFWGVVILLIVLSIYE